VNLAPGPQGERRRQSLHPKNCGGIDAGGNIVLKKNQYLRSMLINA
jgi:hypothetical protein